MSASGGGRSSAGKRHGRKRTKVEKNDTGGTMSSQAPPSADVASSDPFSFEQKIALALQGAKWQEIQKSTEIGTSAAPSEDVQEGVLEEVEVPEGPPEPTAKQKKKKAQFAKTIARDAGEVLQTIEHDDIVPGPQEVTWDSDPELLCCYNWQASTDDNTIFVPGAPAKWQPPTLPHTLDQDSGFQYADYNYARQPRTPYEPMFHALNVMNPTYQFMDVDVLADRNNLRVLLEFVSGKANGPFRLDLYSIFNTLVIVRNEGKWWKFSDGKSYGCNFERFFTRPTEGMEDATSHYRAIRYPMGPLSIVCRFEADAYDDGVAPDELTEFESQAVSGGLETRPSFRFGAPIRVLQKGHIVPTAQMVELKTKAYHVDNFSSVACQDQLWFGRTKLLYTGPYEPGTGVVRRVKYEDATERVRKWEENNQQSLRKLVALLAQLKEIMRQERRPNRAVVLVREDKAGPLTVRSMESSNRAIGRDAFQRHWRREVPQYGPQFGGSRGQRGGARGHYAVPRAGGHANSGGSGRGGGQTGGYQGQSHGQEYTRGGFSGRGRGTGYDGGGSAYVDRGRGGRGSTSGSERGRFGRGEPPTRMPNY